MNKISNKEYNIDFLKSQVDYIVSRLGGGRKISDSDNATYQFQTFCPAHDDHNPSLSIGISNSKPHRILFHCYAGCKQKEVIKAIEEKTGIKISNSLSLEEIEEKKESQDQYKIAEEVNRLFNEASSEEVIKHPYIRKKEIKPYGNVRAKDNELIIPIVDFEGTFHGCQIIYEDGSKKNKKGSKITGNFFVFGEENFERIYITEGYATACSIYQALEEKSLMFVTFTCVNLLPVARKVRDRYPKAEIVICADNDQWTEGNPGVTKAIETAKEVSAKIAIPHFKDTSTKPTDFNDLYVLEGIEEVKTQLKNAEYLTNTEKQFMISDNNQVSKSQEKKKSNQADILTKLAEGEGVELFHTSDQESYARIKINDHYEIYPVRKKAFKQWLARQFYLKTKKTPNSQALNDALNVIGGKALFECKETPVFVRLAEHNGNIYLDLANDKWQVIEISPDGWKVIDDPPVYFRRPKGLLPLPIPKEDGDITLLKQFLNLETEEDWILTVSWLVYALKPGKGYPVLALYGEQGSAKSTFSEILKRIIDPSKAILRTIPRTERDMNISATNSWVLIWDNLSSIPTWLSDAFCRLSTGGGMATRQLCTDNEEVFFEASRPTIINGITDIVNRHDLADRCISITLPPIPKERRVAQEDLFKEFEECIPSILGGLLDAVCVGLKNINHVHLDELPRMANFAKWVVACEPALPWEEGQFIEAYANNRKNIITNAVNTDVFANTLVQWFENKDHWEGTASDLLNELEEFIDNEKITRSKYWPQNERSLGIKLRRRATFLRELNININFTRTGQGRKIILENTCKIMSHMSNMSLVNKNNHLDCDMFVTCLENNKKHVTNMSPSNPLKLLQNDMCDMCDIKKQIFLGNKNTIQNDAADEVNNGNLVDIEVIKPYTNEKGVSYAPGDIISTYPPIAQKLIDKGVAKLLYPVDTTPANEELANLI